MIHYIDLSKVERKDKKNNLTKELLIYRPPISPENFLCNFQTLARAISTSNSHLCEARLLVSKFCR